eukprot:1159853-Pelagomonas_calceolata.AAC.6
MVEEVLGYRLVGMEKVRGADWWGADRLVEMQIGCNNQRHDWLECRGKHRQAAQAGASTGRQHRQEQAQEGMEKA